MYTVYKSTTAKGQYYIGVHKTDNPHDSYVGTGNIVLAMIRKHGKGIFTKQVLCVCQEAVEAFEIEAALVNENRIKDPLCLNLKVGGWGGTGTAGPNHHNHGRVWDKDITKKRGVAISKAKRGVLLSAQHKDALSLAKSHTTYHCINQSGLGVEITNLNRFAHQLGVNPESIRNAFRKNRWYNKQLFCIEKTRCQ